MVNCRGTLATLNNKLIQSSAQHSSEGKTCERQRRKLMGVKYCHATLCQWYPPGMLEFQFSGLSV